MLHQRSGSSQHRQIMSFKQVQAACSYRVWLTLWANEKKNLYFEVSDVVLVCARRWLVKRPISSTHLSLV